MRRQSLGTVMILTMLGCAWLSIAQEGQEQISEQCSRPFLRISEIVTLAEFAGSKGERSDLYPRIGTLIHVNWRSNGQGLHDLLAFEENRVFAYGLGDPAEAADNSQPSHRSEPNSGWLRRFIFLKPSTFVVDDEIQTPSSKKSFRWSLYSHSKPEIGGSLARFTEGEVELLCETLLPKNAIQQIARRPSGRQQADAYLLNVLLPGSPAGNRFLHVLHARRRGDQSSAAHTELVAQNGQLHLTITTDRRLFRLTLPPARMGAGDIAISRSDGGELLARRFLPSGILPHGSEGMRMLDSWDDSYRGGKRPSWDAGRPSGELQRVVEKGIVSACRAVDLGCGSGTDAIYLAGKGFDVTAIDIAPTALSQAEEKARQAGVSVRWLLADVLATPKLEPFDFIFDRGCYHEVRINNANAYVETIRRLSHPGTRFLLLAGNPNELPLQYAPPQVAEEDIRADFSSLFDFEWLRETRFETINPSIRGPLAWSVMLRRKGKP
jgi:SAM-dependent methyltransferase